VKKLVASFGKAINESNDALLFILGKRAVDVEEADISTIGGDFRNVLLPGTCQRHFDLTSEDNKRGKQFKTLSLAVTSWM
jgi:hypothetical protein